MPWRVSTIVLIGDGQFAAIIIGVVLNQRINHGAVGGEIGNHVGLSDDDLAVQDVVIGVVATVDDKGEVHHKSRRVALAVGAGIGFIGRHTVVGQKLVVVIAEDDDASAAAFNFTIDINPIKNVVQIMVLICTWINKMSIAYINRNRVGQERPVGVLRVFLAPMQ